MIETEVPELDPDVWYEICADCQGEWDAHCTTCWDSGLVAHGHLAEAEVTLT